MKKIILLFVATIFVAMSFGQQESERFLINYSGSTTVFDKKILNSTDTIVKVGTASTNCLSGEVFLGRRNFQVGFYGSYLNSSSLTGQYEAEKLEYFSAGMVLRQSINSSELKLGFGYFNQTRELEGYNESFNYFLDSAKIHGIEIFAQFVFSQDDIGCFPKIELWGNTKMFMAKINGGNYKVFLRNYSFGLDVQIYRFSIMPNYYLSPMIGVEKPEIMPGCNSMRYKLGVAAGNNITRSNILKTGIFLSWDNVSYNYTYSYGTYSIKNMVVGGYLSFNPVGIFSHLVR